MFKIYWGTSECGLRKTILKNLGSFFKMSKPRFTLASQALYRNTSTVLIIKELKLLNYDLIGAIS